MPRRRRGLRDHCCYHVTHRCHKREFLFKFARDREVYVELLRETVKRFKIDVLNYVVTSNHVHLLLWVRKGKELSRAMQFLHGEFGQYYNGRKNREGAFWRDRYHSTLVQSGEHLGRCLFYLDMNMVRAGVVTHPDQWRHCGHHELTGARKRYRVINVGRLMKCLRHGADLDGFRDWYSATLNDRLDTAYHAREAYWSESFAVGDPDWISGVYDEFGFKRKKIRSTDGQPLRVEEEAATYYIEG
jgi:putative transposase